jgi:hypothetical protein
VTEQQVVMALTVKGGDTAARALSTVADQTARAGKEANRAAKEFDATAEALKRIERTQRERAVQVEMGRLGGPATMTGARGGDGGGGGALGFLGRFGGPLLAAEGIGRSAMAVSGALNETAEAVLHGRDAVSTFFDSLTKGLPVIGNLWQAFQGFADAIHGGSVARLGTAAFAETSGRMSALAGARGAAEMQAQFAREAIERRREDALAGLFAARRTQGMLTPDVLASFRAEDEFGGMAGGQARRESFFAEQARREAEETASRREQELREAQRRADQLRERIDEQQAASDRARRELLERERELQTLPAGAGRIRRGALEERIELARRNVIGANDLIGALGPQAATAQQEVMRRAQQAEEARLKAVEATTRAMQAGLMEERARLQVLERQREQAKAGAIAAGAAGPGEVAAALAVAKAVQQFGIGGVAPENLGLVEKFGGGRFLDQLRLQRGQQNPDLAAFNRIIGQLNFADVSAQIKRLLDEIEARSSQITVTAAQAIVEALGKGLTEQFTVVGTQLGIQLGVLGAQAVRRMIEAKNNRGAGP